MAHYHLLLFLVGASTLMAAIRLMEAKPVPARRSSSPFAGFHHLIGSMDDVSAVPTMMMMPSFVYYQMVSPFNSPFQRMIKPASWSAFDESSEEEEEEGRT
ncbi:hypothetical protein OUZ56_006298 [Daphnia magna]|uniref:Uncharacterized protein n=1 Tax=Daphnia magna TaxID=35525 RepID=A0ABQ9YV82_9CRUS|nr:hypothetical protein OUZ56_006298 [Daphnia magna]